MAKQAKLADGSILNFPDDTPDEVVHATVKKHVAHQNYNAAVEGNDVVPFVKGIANKIGPDFVAGVGSLAHNLWGTVTTGDPMEGRKAMKEYSELAREVLPRFSGDKVTLAEESLSDKYEENVLKTGREVGAFGSKYGISGLPRLLMTPEQRGKLDAAYETAGEFGVQVVADPTNLLTGAGAAKGAARVAKGAPAKLLSNAPVADPLLAKATELAKAAGRELPTQQDYITAARLAEGERDPNAIQYTGPDLSQPAPMPPKAAPLSEVPALDMPPSMGLESDTQAALRGALGPAQRSAREGLDTAIERPVGDVNHLDPVALSRAREAPEAGALPEGTAPYQAALDFSKPAELGMPESRLNPRTEDGLYALPADKAAFEYPKGEIIPDQRGLFPSRMAEADPFNKNYGLASKATTVEQLDHIAKTSESEFNRTLAEHIRDTNPEYNAKLTVQDRITRQEAGLTDKDLAGVVRGLMDDRRGVILSKEGQGHISENTVLHENVHGILARVVDQWERNLGPVDKKLSPYLTNLENLYKFVKEALAREEHYALRDMNEFITETFTNPAFRERMAELQLVPSHPMVRRHKLHELAQTAWDAMTSTMLRILGMKPTRENMSALAHILNQTNQLMREVGADPRAASKYYTKQALHWNEARTGDFRTVAAQVSKAPEVKPKSLAEYKEELLTKGIRTEHFQQALYNKYLEEWKADNAPRPYQSGYDNRPVSEMKQDLYRKDGTMRIDDVGTLTGTAFHQSKQHVIIKYAYDQISQMTTKVDNIFNQYFRGAEIVRGGWNLDKKVFTLNAAKKVENPNSVSALGRKLPTSDWMSIAKLNDMKTINKDDPISLRAAGLSPSAIQFVTELRKQNKALWEAANKVRKGQGLGPIPYNDDFLWSHVRGGGYQVWVQKDGKHGVLIGTNTYADAEKAAAKLREQGHNAYAGMSEDNPLQTPVPSADFMAAGRLLDDKTLREQFSQAAQEALKRTGIKQYWLRRDSEAGGYAGSAEMINTLGEAATAKSIQKSIETYFGRMSRYLATEGHMERLNGLFGDSQIAQDFPNAVARSKYMMEMYKGAPQLGQELLSKVSKWFGTWPVLKNFVDADTGERMLTGTGHFFIMNNVVHLNPVFIGSQMLNQHLAVPNLMRLNAEHFEGRGNVMEAALKGQTAMFVPTSRTKDILVKALDSGAIEPRFVEALDWLQTENRAIAGVKVLQGEKLSGWADSFGRASAYMMNFEFGKTLKMTDEQAHSFAARETKGVMGEYERWARQRTLNELGVVGEMTAPLTHFISNYIYNLSDYVKSDLHNHKVVGATMTLMAMQLAMAGVRGLPFYQDLETAWMTLNESLIGLGYKPFKTPAEFMSDLGMGTGWQYGLISKATGVDVTGTLGTGAIVGSIGNVLGLSYAWDYAKAIATLVDPRATDNDKRAAWMRLPPPLIKQLANSLFQGKAPLEPTDALNSKGLPIYQRNAVEQKAAILSGKSPVRESEAKRAEFERSSMTKAVQETVRKASENIVEELATGKDLSPFVQRVIENYPQEMMAVIKNLPDAVQKYNKDRALDAQTRAMIEAKTNMTKQEILRSTYKNLNESIK